jgi:ArsR family transcriptional regulator
MTDLVAFGKALSDPTRVRILNALLQSELCVCELVDALEIGQSSLSSHLQMLRSNGIVVTEKRRSWIIYSIAPSAREAVRTAFTHLPPEEVEGDNERLANRIKLRVDGCCVVGFSNVFGLRKGTQGRAGLLLALLALGSGSYAQDKGQSIRPPVQVPT